MPSVPLPKKLYDMALLLLKNGDQVNEYVKQAVEEKLQRDMNTSVEKQVK